MEHLTIFLANNYTFFRTVFLIYAVIHVFDRAYFKHNESFQTDAWKKVRAVLEVIGLSSGILFLAGFSIVFS